MFRHDEEIKNAFLIKEKNEAGIYAVKFYVRAKPVVIVVDDVILLLSDDRTHRFGVYNRQFGTIWPLVLEKAFAKLKGNYINMAAGYPNTVFRAILGIPCIHYLFEHQNPSTMY